VIPVAEQPEPPDFDTKVRIPGRAFLTVTSAPTTEEFGKKNYWKEIIFDLWDAYYGICAYSCHWIPRTTGARSVEHFLPKSLRPDLAYEWSNYRLVCSRLNSRKGNFQDVVDPFYIQYGWFILEFPDMIIKPNVNLSPALMQQVKDTIKRLQLNDDETLVKDRWDWIEAYVKKEITFKHLTKKAPFIAYELKRQKLKTKIHAMVKMPGNKPLPD
jgi:hypothetical protein